MAGDKLAYAAAVGAAVASASFAGYMWVETASPVATVEKREAASTADLLRDDHPLASDRALNVTVSSIPQPLPYDPITTGALPRSSDRQTSRRAAVRSSDFAGPQRVLSGFALVGVYGDVALVRPQAAGSEDVWLVKPGTEIPGAGRVTEIARRGRQWIVMTSKGTIRAGSTNRAVTR